LDANGSIEIPKATVNMPHLFTIPSVAAILT